MVNEPLKKNSLNLNLDSVFIVDSLPISSSKVSKSPRINPPNEDEFNLIKNINEPKNKNNIILNQNIKCDENIENLSWKFLNQINILDCQLRDEEKSLFNEDPSTSREELLSNSNLHQQSTSKNFHLISSNDINLNQNNEDNIQCSNDNDLKGLGTTKKKSKPLLLSNIMSTSGSPISTTDVHINITSNNLQNLNKQQQITSSNNINNNNHLNSNNQLKYNLKINNINGGHNKNMNKSEEILTKDKKNLNETNNENKSNRINKLQNTGGIATNRNNITTTKMNTDLSKPAGEINMGFADNIGFNLGLYGWRKKCLYSIILVLLILIIVNLILTLWILKVMEFSSEGMGQLKIIPGGIQLSGQALVMDLLRASTIRSKHGQPIILESSRNFSINTRDSNGILENQLFLGHDKLECLANGFRINDTNGRNLFSVNRNEVIIGAHSLKIDGEGGAQFRDSIQTSHIRADAGRELRLESPTRQLDITAAKDINIQSRAGGLDISALDDVKLSAIEGSIRLESSKIFFPNLRVAQLPTSSTSSSQNHDHSHRVYQLCACSNGKLFLASPHSICAGDDSTVCR